jgi:nucleoside 2-deoxyribosyltransferase
MPIIYLAGPLFSEAERQWHRATRSAILAEADKRGRHDIEIVWPYELISKEETASLGDKARHEIFRRCIEGLEKSDMLVAMLDGAQVDDGTAWEIGYFYAAKSTRGKIIGIRTDFRNAGESAGATVNAMIEVSCHVIVQSIEELMPAIFE